MTFILTVTAFFYSTQLFAQNTPSQTAREIVEAGITAHGGKIWLYPDTLMLEGEADFYNPSTGSISAHADSYRMWRQMDNDRRVAHGAQGKVRITAKAGDRVIFEVGYDGEQTWTDKGIMPQEQADVYWANNFGFGIIRSALNDGFQLERAPSRDIDGHMVDLIRVIDPQGQQTLFGFDRESHLIRYMAFRSPRGFHERYYDDFMRLPLNGWVQARSVTLFYDGVKANRVFWQTVVVGKTITPALFTHPPG
ncbi:MAG: hypothetical protein ACK5NN_09610 [Sphingomonadaceae bacterium]